MDGRMCLFRFLLQLTLANKLDLLRAQARELVGRLQGSARQGQRLMGKAVIHETFPIAEAAFETPGGLFQRALMIEQVL